MGRGRHLRRAVGLRRATARRPGSRDVLCGEPLRAPAPLPRSSPRTGSAATAGRRRAETTPARSRGRHALMRSRPTCERTRGTRPLPSLRSRGGTFRVFHSAGTIHFLGRNRVLHLDVATSGLCVVDRVPSRPWGPCRDQDVFAACVRTEYVLSAPRRGEEGALASLVEAGVLASLRPLDSAAPCRRTGVLLCADPARRVSRWRFPLRAAVTHLELRATSARAPRSSRRRGARRATLRVAERPSRRELAYAKGWDRSRRRPPEPERRRPFLALEELRQLWRRRTAQGRNRN